MTFDPLAAARRLAAVLTAENLALDALDVAGAIALLPDKRDALAALTAAQSLPLAADQQTDMAAIVQQLRDLAEENRQLLQRALTVQTRVLEVIAGALPRDSGGGRYAPPGARVPLARPAAWSIAAHA